MNQNYAQPLQTGALTLMNRLIRSATYENCCSTYGMPEKPYYRHYEQLSGKSIGAVITGFFRVSEEGRAIQPRQASLASSKNIEAFKPITELFHHTDTRIICQLAHCGRQTSSRITRHPVWGISTKQSPYFRSEVRLMTNSDKEKVINDFVHSAKNAYLAGFHGIELHAAHGYLLHQMLNPYLNQSDHIENTPGIQVLTAIIEQIRNETSSNFAIWIQISGSAEPPLHYTTRQLSELASFLQRLNIDAVEISHGTMEYPLNIIRGKTPCKELFLHNPVLNKRLNHPLFSKAGIFLKNLLRKKAFTEAYNRKYVKVIREYCTHPLILTGGIRKGNTIENLIKNTAVDAVSFCRPFLKDPFFAQKLIQNTATQSTCSNCNICLAMCDSQAHTKCYTRRNA